jgi:cation transport regulator ChaC
LLEDYPELYDRRLLPTADDRLAWIYLGQPHQVHGCRRVPFDDWGATPVFSYGSNLCPDQLAQRCGSWDGTGLVARLEGWRWAISKIRVGRGKGEGAAGLRPDPEAHCWGVVHHLRPADRGVLDQREGVAIGHYRHQSVTVTTLEGERFEALTYVPTPQWTSESLRPAADYAGRILRGAHHWDLPEGWREQLRQALKSESLEREETDQP